MNRNGTHGSTELRKARTAIRCAIYTRKSTDEGLDQAFNSLDAQREAAEAYIASQKAEGWTCLSERYDDGGYSGGNMDRPALARLLKDIEAGKIDVVVVYKVDRLSRSLLDFARLMALFDQHKVSFVSVTQHFNTTHSMGRLTLNILLSFAQFEREIISERTRDKIAATRRKGKWTGGRPILGYDVRDMKLVVNRVEAERVRAIFTLYLKERSLLRTARALNHKSWTTKCWITRAGQSCGGRPFDKVSVMQLLTNVVYLGKIKYKTEVHPGEHEAIVEEAVWQKANQMLRANGRSGGTHVRNKHGALLKGLLYCAPCKCKMGHTYSVKNGRSLYRYYLCYTAQRQGWDRCPSKALPAEELERFVVSQIKVIGKDPVLQTATLAQVRQQEREHLAQLESERQTLERDWQTIKAELQRAAANAVQDRQATLQLAHLHERKRALERQRVEVQTRIEQAQAQPLTPAELDAALAAFDEVWATLHPREQAEALRLLIQKVEYDGPRGTVKLTFWPSGLRTLAQEQPA